MSKVSVIMPVYNSEKYIRASLESVLNQTFRDFELLVIYDNGTIDNTVQIIEEYQSKDSRVKPINIREDTGLVKALNYGIKISTGEYIARMDSDDICLPDRFEKQIKYLDENSDISILGTNIYLFNNRGRVWKRGLTTNFTDSNVLELAFQYTIIPHPTVMLRRNIFDVLIGYDEHMKESEDFDLWLRAARYGFKIRCLHERLVKYRVYSESKDHLANGIRTYVILSRINCIRSLKEIKKYLIWGKGTYANSLCELIKNNYSDMELTGYIDANAQPDDNNEDIKEYKPEKITELEFDYIFITDAPKDDSIENYLISLGYLYINDYSRIYD